MGRLSGSQQLHLALTLRLRNQEELLGLLRDLYDPASPDYRHFLTVEEFTDRFGPTAEDYERVAEFARSNGLVVTQTAANRLVLDVSGMVANIERAFHVKLQVYPHPTEHRTFYAPDVEPSLEPSLPVQGVQGLNNFEPPHPANLKLRPSDKGIAQDVTGSGPGGWFLGSDIRAAYAPGVTPDSSSGLTGSAPGGWFLGSDIRAAYAPGVTLDGSGQALGLFEEAPYNLSDVQLYFTSANQPLNVPIVNVLLDGFSGVCAPGCNDGEQALDIEQAISMAPNLSALIVYEGLSDVDILNQMATDNIAKQLSCSYVWGPDPSSVEPIFQQFAAQGQNFFASSGDGGAFTPPSCTSNCYSALFPAADPYVTAVGGTWVTTTGPGGNWQSETAWQSSGGGVTSYPIQSYQAPLINALNQGSTTLRNVPDVAAVAFGVWICSQGTCSATAGTSVSAPLWAGFMALANQQANGTPIGFLNPTVYALAQGFNYGNDFHDITTGNNFESWSPDLYSAVAGYDLVTGLGTPNGQSLLNVLGPATTGPNFTLTSSPSALSLTLGSQGTSTITVEALSGFSGMVSLRGTVLGQSSGVTVSFDPAVVTGSGTSTLTVSTADSALNPSITIVVTGVGGGLTQTAYLTLEVLMPNLVETAVSAPPASLNAGSGFSVTDTTQNTGNAPAGASVTGYYLSATTSKTVESHLLGTRTVPSLAINAVSTGTAQVTVPSGLWPNTPYHLLACADDRGSVVQASTSNCIASSSTSVFSQASPPTASTTLAVTAGGSAVTTVASGTVVTLTATVNAGSSPVTPGQVNFCDATATHCTDIHLLGTAQLTSTGTAVIKFRPGIGGHSYKAIFAGTITAAGSSSGTSALTVTGTYPTESTLAASGSASDYTLTATVTGSGPVAPSGEVSFLDTSGGNSVLGTATLTAGTPGLNWTNSQTPTGGYPSSVAVADFNGDGVPDLAVATVAYCTLTVLLGNGDGTFYAAPAPTVGCINPVSVAVGDFNGDGKADLAVATNGTDELVILLGNGDGTFTQVPGPLAIGPILEAEGVAMVVGDFNGDGKADLAIANALVDSAGGLTILLGNGDGTFTPAASPMAVYDPISLALGDFNGDGKEDLAVVDFANGSLTILLGNGDGTFTAAANPYVIAGTPYSVAVGDFNGDGKADLAVADINGATVTILLGNGDGTFTSAAATPPTGSGPFALAVGDFNSDGKADLAVANIWSSSVTILLGNGDGTFNPASVSPATGTSPESLAVADFNGDGNADLAVGNEVSGTATILLTQPTAQATATASGIVVLGSGTHLVEASYPGDSSYASSVSSTTALTATTAPVAGVSPSALAFAARTVNSTSSPQVVTLSNSGGLALSVASVAISGDFSEANNCGSSVTAGGSCTISVTFTPSAAGTRTGTLTITDNNNGATGSTQTVSLTGTGTTPAPLAGISPASLTFAATMVNSSTSSQTVTLSNTGSAALSVAGIAASANFAQTNNCGSGVAVGGSCTIKVTFSPTKGGALTGTLTLADNSNNTTGSTQTASLSGTGEDFTLTLASGSSSSASISPGQNATYTLAVGSEGGMSQSINFICTDSASESTCTVSPNPGTPGSNTAVTVSTTAGSALAPRNFPAPRMPSPPVLLVLALLLAGVSWTVRAWREVESSRRRRVFVPLVAGLLFALALIGCGGGGGSSSSPPPNPGTPAGTYNLTVTGTVGSGSTAVSHSMTLTLTVS